MMAYKIEFYAHLPKTYVNIFFHYELRSDPDPIFSS